MKLEVNSVEDLLDLGEKHKGSSAIVGKGFMRKMYIYLWHKDRDTGIEYGEWKFACYPSKP